jgi:hypothetical protein
MRVISKYPAELMTEEPDVVMHMTDTSTQTAQERVQNLAAIPKPQLLLEGAKEG